MSVGEQVTRFGIGPPNAQNFGFVPNATSYWDTSTTPWTLYGFLTGQGWNQVGAGSTAGDVTGPAGAVANNFPQFNGATGKLIKDSGTAPSTDGTFSANSDALIPTQKATKTYVDAVASGLDVRASVLLASAGALPTNTYSNGASGVGATLTATGNAALTVDGTAVAVGNRLLIKDEAAAANNGIYTVTATGDGSNPYVLTRATDFNSAANIVAGAFTFVETGTANAGSGWVLAISGAVVVGTTALPWTQFSGAGEITAGTGLTKSGNTLSITSTGVGAGSVGSASAIPVVTFNAQGQATVKSTATPARVLISEVVTSGSQNAVTFSSIPNTYRDLEIVVRGRGDTSATGVAINLTMNNDTGSNYLFAGAFLTQTVSGYGTVGLTTSISAFGLPAATASSNRSGLLTYKIGDYRGTTFGKPVELTGGYSINNSSGQTGAGDGGGEWVSTSAVNRVDLTCNAGNFVDGSVVSLYGLM